MEIGKKGEPKRRTKKENHQTTNSPNQLIHIIQAGIFHNLQYFFPQVNGHIFPTFRHAQLCSRLVSLSEIRPLYALSPHWTQGTSLLGLQKKCSCGAREILRRGDCRAECGNCSGSFQSDFGHFLSKLSTAILLQIAFSPLAAKRR